MMYVDEYSSRSKSLLVLLDTLASHAIDDRVEARVHVAQAVGDACRGQAYQQTRPEEDVEHGRILIAVEGGRVRDAVLII